MVPIQSVYSLRKAALSPESMTQQVHPSTESDKTQIEARNAPSPHFVHIMVLTFQSGISRVKPYLVDLAQVQLD